MAPLPPDYYHEKLLIVQVKTAALAPVQSSWNPMGLPNSVNAWLLDRFKSGIIKHAEPLVRLGTPVFRVTNPLAPTSVQLLQAGQWRELAFPRLAEELATVPDSISAQRQAWFLRLRSQIYIHANSGLDCSALREEAITLAENGMRVVDFAEFVPKYTLAHPIPLDRGWPPNSTPAPGGGSSDPGRPQSAPMAQRPEPSNDPGSSLTAAGVPADPLTDYINPLWAHSRVNWIIPSNPPQIAIATLDTGVQWTHDSFSGGALKVAKDFYFQASPDWEDIIGHGTSVASILAARLTKRKIPLEWEYDPIRKPNAKTEDRSFQGMLPTSFVYPYKVMKEVNAFVDPQLYISAFASIYINADTTGIRAINISIYKMSYTQTGTGRFQSEEGWINYLEGKNILCVACTGNNYNYNGSGADWVDASAPYKVEFPAQNVKVLAVGAALRNGQLAPFSNYTINGDQAAVNNNSTGNRHIDAFVARDGESPPSSLDVIAPGKNMLTALPKWTQNAAHPIWGLGVCYRNGTSFAAPMVTAVAAWLAATTTLKPDKIRKAIRLSAFNNPFKPSQAPDKPGAAKAGMGLLNCKWLAEPNNLKNL